MVYSRVKITVVERDGQELEWREESSSSKDLLEAVGIIPEGVLTIAGGSNLPYEDGFPGGQGSVYFASNGNSYNKQLDDDKGWFKLINTSLWYIEEPSMVPDYGQLVLHNRPLVVNNTLWLGLASDIIFDII